MSMEGTRRRGQEDRINKAPLDQEENPTEQARRRKVVLLRKPRIKQRPDAKPEPGDLFGDAGCALADTKKMKAQGWWPFWRNGSSSERGRHLLEHIVKPFQGSPFTREEPGSLRMALVSTPQEACKFLGHGGSNNRTPLLGGVRGKELLTPWGRDVRDNDMRQGSQPHKLIGNPPREVQRASMLRTHLRSINQRIRSAKDGHEGAPIKQGRSPAPEEAKVQVVRGLCKPRRLESNRRQRYALFPRRPQ